MPAGCVGKFFLNNYTFFLKVICGTEAWRMLSFACPRVLRHTLQIDQMGTVLKFRGCHPIQEQYNEKTEREEILSLKSEWRGSR